MISDAHPFEKSFRLFVTNGRGRIDRAAQVICAASDEDAVIKSIEAVGRAAFELWDGTRRVAVEGRGERDANRPGE